MKERIELLMKYGMTEYDAHIFVRNLAMEAFFDGEDNKRKGLDSITFPNYWLQKYPLVEYPYKD